MRRLFYMVLLGVFLGFTIQMPGFAAEQQGPNVVIVFADDLGYGDLSCYGAEKVRTPHIDRLAREGRMFTDAHSASAVCTPSRYALLTGEYPLRKNLSKPVFLKTGLVIGTAQQTIASVMQDAGYATACIGKWHLGFGTYAPDWNGELKPGPLELGFDYYFGVPVVNSHPPFVYVENYRVVGLVPDDPFVFGKKAKTREFPEKMGMDQIGGADAAHALYDDEAVGTTLAGKAVDWIRDRGKNPFFLYLATTNIHHPFTPAPRFKGTSGCGRYGDFVHELDWMVGEIMKTLEAQGVADNTLVIFTSDNGGMFNIGGQDAWDAGHRLNGELLGFKFGAWEGGHRVPFIARWPGKIEANSTSDQLISNIDMIATLAALTRSTLKPGQGRDSVNVLSALTGDPIEPLRDHLVLAPNKPTHLAVRKGKWIYIGAQGSGGFTGAKRGGHAFGGPAAITYAGYRNSDIENGKIKPDAPPAQLYDLQNDLKQTQNLYREHPEVAKELKALLESYASPERSSAPVKPKYDEYRPLGELRFTFESGELDGWSIVEGAAGRPVSNHVSLPRWRDKPFNREGKFHLSTVDTADEADHLGRPRTAREDGILAGRRQRHRRLGTLDIRRLFRRWQTYHARRSGPGSEEKTSMKKTLLTSAALLVGVCAQAAEKPNIILVLADDIGISGISCYGSDSFKTPHIDKLSADGIQFNYAFSHPICGPSRACLMTGRYPFRTGGLGNRSSQEVSPLKETPFPRLLKEAGYATFATGKWPWLGHMENAEAWGFDEMVTWRNYSTPDRYWDPNLYVDGVLKSFPGEYGPDVMQDSIFAFIDKVKKESPEKPFFVYYPSVLPHGPMVHTPDSASADITKKEKYRDMVLYMDKQVGDLRERLETRNLAHNTLIIFTGDNGSDAPMKEIINGKAILGSKGRMNDGGVWVPWICHWPAAIKPGQQTDTLVDFSDFFPTLLDVAGIEAPGNIQLDGQSFAPVLRGEKHKGRDWVYYQRDDNYAVRNREWKLNDKGILYDMSLAPHQEIPIDPATNAETRAAHDELNAALAELDPRGGFVSPGSKP